MSLLRQKEVQERGGIPQVPFYQWMGTNIERVHVLNLKVQEVSKGEDSDGGEVRTQEREVTRKRIHRREYRLDPNLELRVRLKREWSV